MRVRWRNEQVSPPVPQLSASHLAKQQMYIMYTTLIQYNFKITHPEKQRMHILKGKWYFESSMIYQHDVNDAPHLEVFYQLLQAYTLNTTYVILSLSIWKKSFIYPLEVITKRLVSKYLCLPSSELPSCVLFGLLWSKCIINEDFFHYNLWFKVLLRIIIHYDHQPKGCCTAC